PFCLIVLYFSVSLDSAFGQMSGCCTYQSIEKALFEYEIKYTYNKTLFMEYNSTRGNWMGFTPLGVFWANIYNRDPWDPEQRKVEQLMLYVNDHVPYNSVHMTLKQPSGTHPALLLCSAYNFYPQDIELTWFQNGQEVTSGVSSTEVLSDGDLYYQIHSYLEYSPKLGEEISCMVEHVSLSEPLVQAWDPPHSLPWSERVKIVLGTLFLVVGLTMLAIGYVKHKKHSAALCTIGQGKLVIMPSQCYKINEHL
uniref:Ig-like domain-containing protein n=1 Tax=Neogobius melanostomus TaxID=47308 RepID=A0A8C6WR46_9GOBI